MLRALLSLGNEHVLRPFDLELVRRSRVPSHVDESQQTARRIAFFHPPKCERAAPTNQKRPMQYRAAHSRRVPHGAGIAPPSFSSANVL